jgi:hypothetical protein
VLSLSGTGPATLEITLVSSLEYPVAEARVHEIAKARMGKKQLMRWSPRGAHRVALVRAAVRDGRLKSCDVIQLSA